MRKLNFQTDRNYDLGMNSTPPPVAPLPYFIPVPPPPPPPPRPPPSSSAAAAAAAAVDNIIVSLQQMEMTDTSHFFNPYYYTADEPFELGPKEFVAVYFDRDSDHNRFESRARSWNAYKSCLKKQHVFFVLQNISSGSILKIPTGTRLLDILILSDIKSCVIPVTRSFSFYDENNM